MREKLRAAFAAGLLAALGAVQAAEPGVRVTFTAPGGATDARRDRLVALTVPVGTAPSALLPAGAFRATWETSLTLPLRGEFTFSFAGAGTAKLAVNGEPVLDESAATLGLKRSATVKLNKGANKISVAYEPPAAGEARFRLLWAGKDFRAEPLPPAWLTCEAPAQVHTRIRTGRALAAELHCASCHELGVTPAMPEFADAPPSLDEAGARFRPEWLAAWIADPKKLRPDTAMPRVHLTSAQEAADIAAWLTAQGKPAAEPKFGAALAATGAELFTNLHCVACHALPGRPAVAGELTRVSLALATAKWRPAALVDFLRNPAENHAAVRMPYFNLSVDEARALAAFLLSAGGEKLSGLPGGDAARGRALFATAGCASCHAPGAAAKKSPARDLQRGCLAESEGARGVAPDFALGADDREALRAMVEDKFAALRQDAPAEYAERQFAALRCAACHSRDGRPAAYAALAAEIKELRGGAADEGDTAAGEESLAQEPPDLTWAGEKLRPDFLRHQLAGDLGWRARPWLSARMPAFSTRAKFLAAGLAAQHGMAFAEPPAAAPDVAKARLGAQLLGVDGFNCTACHAVGAQPASAPFGAPGVDFTRVATRVRPEFFQRWLDDPQRITPGSKMPKFTAPDGRSTRPDVLGGEAHAQWAAIYDYLRKISP